VTRHLGAASALLLLVLAASVAAAVGYAVGRESKPPVETAHELVLSPVPTPPSLPAYDPGSGWFALPKPPSPTPVETQGEGETSGPYGGTEGEGVIEEPVKKESSGGGSGGRCFGIGFGNDC
jgi:hypothetical protein